MIGVYEIVNLINDKVYIGSSSDIPSRWREHLKCLRGGYHTNRHLQASFDKYGEDAFAWHTIEECPIELLLVHEQEFIDYLKPAYNKALIAGSGPSPLGKKHSAETRAKMSRSQSANVLAGTHGHWPMRVWTEEQKRQCSVKQRGQRFTEEHRAKLSESHKGQSLSDETRRKLSEAATRQWQRQRV